MDFDLGYSPSLINLSYKDQLDNSLSNFSIVPFSFVAKTKSDLSRYSNWIIDLGHHSISFDADTDRVGQSLTSFYISTSFEKRHSFNRNFSIFFGGGLGLATNKIGGAHTIDADRYLADKYDADSSTTIFTTLHATHYSKIDDFEVAYKLYYKHDPKFLSGLGFSFVFFFN